MGSTWGQLGANMAPLGQLGANMSLAKPEKLMFRLDRRTLLTKLYVSPWTRFGRPWGCLGRSWVRLGWTSGEALGTPWKALGTPWRILLGKLFFENNSNERASEQTHQTNKTNKKSKICFFFIEKKYYEMKSTCSGVSLRTSTTTTDFRMTSGARLTSLCILNLI